MAPTLYSGSSKLSTIKSPRLGKVGLLKLDHMEESLACVFEEFIFTDEDASGDSSYSEESNI